MFKVFIGKHAVRPQICTKEEEEDAEVFPVCISTS